MTRADVTLSRALARLVDLVAGNHDVQETRDRLRAAAVTLAEQLDRYAHGQEDVAA